MRPARGRPQARPSVGVLRRGGVRGAGRRGLRDGGPPRDAHTGLGRLRAPVEQPAAVPAGVLLLRAGRGGESRRGREHAADEDDGGAAGPEGVHDRLRPRGEGQLLPRRG